MNYFCKICNKKYLINNFELRKIYHHKYNLWMKDLTNEKLTSSLEIAEFNYFKSLYINYNLLPEELTTIFKKDYWL